MGPLAMHLHPQTDLCGMEWVLWPCIFIPRLIYVGWNGSSGHASFAPAAHYAGHFCVYWFVVDASTHTHTHTHTHTLHTFYSCTLCMIPHTRNKIPHLPPHAYHLYTQHTHTHTQTHTHTHTHTYTHTHKPCTYDIPGTYGSQHCMHQPHAYMFTFNLFIMARRRGWTPPPLFIAVILCIIAICKASASFFNFQIPWFSVSLLLVFSNVIHTFKTGWSVT